MSVSRDTTTSHDITTDAGFRAWAQTIHDRFAAVGLVQTSDTGQINLSTVTTPGANNTAGGYEIWRFSDAQQASDPIYFKFEYGRGGAADRPRIWITVGSGSDGSGNITGTNISSANDQSSAVMPTSSGTGAGTVHCAYKDGALLLFCHTQTSAPTNNGLRYGMFIERLRTPVDYTFIPGAVCLGVWSSSTPNLCSKDGAQKYNATGGSGSFLQNNTTVSGADGSDMWFGAIFPQTKKVCAPLISMLLPKQGDAANGDTGNIEMYGTTRNYRIHTGAMTVNSNASCIYALLNE